MYGKFSEQDNNGFAFLVQISNIEMDISLDNSVYQTDRGAVLLINIDFKLFCFLYCFNRLLLKFSSVDYDYPTKDVFKIYSSQEEDSMGSPVISRAVQYSTPMENEVQRISVQPKEVERTKIIENHDDSLKNGRYDNGSI
ncbi:unnamed protein product, partial [Brugia pahangi]|uniref:CS domain-containing protein n=1 Tax=Brugia pahangi TaxID=6280 RepID=A0A0N4TGM7_BRUPA